MSDNAPTSSKKKPADKLAKALRDNLHRRKAQARARAKTDTAADDAAAALQAKNDQDEITNG